MPLIKLGEATEIKLENPESCIPEVSAEVLENFRKYASNLKKIAPKAEDFLYFSAVMMHAAEASALNDDGTPRLTLKGEPVKVSWDKSGGSWKWVTNDPNIKPYKNSNGDIFPEEELTKAYKKWKHKPLCVDHKSSSVDHVRGFIVDTYYDRNLKRVIALCALDRAGYPNLARNVATGVSNCVSMGTAVGRAICYDCGKVARTEQDFCKHMVSKSCYGEINVDLTPIELSIVVNGADPKANIKHIIASANTMNTYLENRSKELAKLASYHATLIKSSEGQTPVDQIMSVQVQGDDLDSFKSDIDRGLKELASYNSNFLEKDTNDLALNQSSGTLAMDEGSPTDSELSLQTPQTARFASASVDADSLAELQTVAASIEAKLSQMKQSLDKLAKTSTKTHEENMSDKLNKSAYFQGAGGVNEPTPGQVKYPKDPLNEQLREHEDKQMVGQPPFPEVGDVKGMHPSPASVDPSAELERKKMLARAQFEENIMKRNAIVSAAKDALKQKEAYWQGGGGVNEPTPGKAKYPKDKLNEELREYEDKQMVGQPPFPGVGAVDGLHPSPSSADPKDELKRKEMLARAGKLHGRFVKAFNTDGSLNKSKSAWEVFLGDKLLVNASVHDLCGGHVTDVLYENIATKPFGASLIEKVKVNGSDAVNKMIKKAQAAPPPPPSDPGAGAPPPGGDAGSPDMGPSTEDSGKSGDPKGNALALAEKVRDLGSDLVEAVRALTGEQVEMGAETGAPAMADDSSSEEKVTSASLNTLRRELNSGLMISMKEAIANLRDQEQELKMIAGMYDKGAFANANEEFVDVIVNDALTEAKTAIADGHRLMVAFIKYANGTLVITKRAAMQSQLEALAEGDSTMTDTKDSHSADGGDLMALINDTNADLDMVQQMVDDNDHGDMGDEPHDELSEFLEGEGSDLDLDDDNAGAMVASPQQAAELLSKKPDASVTVQASYDTRSGRAALRAKLAADATGKEENGEIQDMSKQKFSDMLDAADKHADGQTQLDVKPSDDLGLVETLEEQNKAMMELAKAPPNVRKEAESIQNLVASGKIAASDVDELAAYGLDKDAISYWKKYYGEVDGGNEFASELVKEHVKASVEEKFYQYRVKLGRAYELAYDMADRGLCHQDRSAISSQVDEIMKFNDDSFDSLKKVVARHSPSMRKEAGRIPQVGLVGNGDVVSKVAAAQSEDEYAQLSSMFGTKKGVF